MYLHLHRGKQIGVLFQKKDRAVAGPIHRWIKEGLALRTLQNPFA